MPSQQGCCTQSRRGSGTGEASWTYEASSVCSATAESAKTLTGLVTVNNTNKIATRLVYGLYVRSKCSEGVALRQINIDCDVNVFQYRLNSEVGAYYLPLPHLFVCHIVERIKYGPPLRECKVPLGMAQWTNIVLLYSVSFRHTFRRNLNLQSGKLGRNLTLSRTTEACTI